MFRIYLFSFFIFVSTLSYGVEISRVGPDAEIIPGEYIVSFKPQSNTDLKVVRSEQAGDKARRLISEAHQLRQKNVKSNKPVGPNENQEDHIFFIYNAAFEGFSGKLTKETLEYIRNSEEVESIMPDIKTHTAGTQVQPLTYDSYNWGLDRIDQRRFPLDYSYQYNATGAGVHVFIVDNGVTTNDPEFTGRVGEGFDATGEGNPYIDCTNISNYTHGQWVARLIGGSWFGVAKNVIVHSVRITDCDGAGQLSWTINGINWAAGTSYRPAVMNLSIQGGSMGTTLNEPRSSVASRYQPLISAFQNVVSHGIVLVAAAGNNRIDTCDEAVGGNAHFTGGIAVSSSMYTNINSGPYASDAAEAYDTTLSNNGRCSDIFAPGDIITIDYQDRSNHTGPLATSGTSVATAFVSGAAALLLEKKPTLNPLFDSTYGLLVNATPLTPTQAGSMFSNMSPAGTYSGPQKLLYTAYIGAWSDTGSGGSGSSGGSTNLKRTNAYLVPFLNYMLTNH